MSYRPLSMFSLFACCFFQIELYQKKLSQFFQGWSVHTSWSLTRSKGWILFTYFLLFRWDFLCDFWSSEHQIPVTLLTLELSGLDSESNGCGVDLVAAEHDVSWCLLLKVTGTLPSLVSHLHLIFECSHWLLFTVFLVKLGLYSPYALVTSDVSRLILAFLCSFCFSPSDSYFLRVIMLPPVTGPFLKGSFLFFLTT